MKILQQGFMTFDIMSLILTNSYFIIQVIKKKFTRFSSIKIQKKIQKHRVLLGLVDKEVLEDSGFPQPL